MNDWAEPYQHELALRASKFEKKVMILYDTKSIVFCEYFVLKMYMYIGARVKAEACSQRHKVTRAH